MSTETTTETVTEVKPVGLTEAVRQVLTATPDLTTAQVVTAVKEQYPHIEKVAFRPVFGAIRRIAKSAEKKAAKAVATTPAEA